MMSIKIEELAVEVLDRVRPHIRKLVDVSRLLKTLQKMFGSYSQ